MCGHCLLCFNYCYISLLKLPHLFQLQRDADVDRKIQDFVVTEGGIICQLSQKILDAVIVKIRKIPKRGQPREVLPNCRQFFPGRFLSPL